jgi:hypothetical protein
VKQWPKEFAEYLSLTAQPAKGIERQFSEADLRVLAVGANHLELGTDSDHVLDYVTTTGDFFIDFGSPLPKPSVGFMEI